MNIEITPLPPDITPPDSEEWLEVLHCCDLYTLYHTKRSELPCFGVAVYLRRKPSNASFRAAEDLLTVTGRPVDPKSTPICGTCGKLFDIGNVSEAARILAGINGGGIVEADEVYVEAWKLFIKQKIDALLGSV